MMSVQQFTGTKSLNYQPSGSLSVDLSPQPGLPNPILALFQNTVKQTRLSSTPPPAKLSRIASTAISLPLYTPLVYCIHEEYQFAVLPIDKGGLRLMKTGLCCGMV